MVKDIAGPSRSLSARYCIARIELIKRSMLGQSGNFGLRLTPERLLPEAVRGLFVAVGRQDAGNRGFPQKALGY